MPVTTRAATLRSQANADLIHLQDQATPTSTSTGKTTRKYSSKQKRKQAQGQQIISSVESQICSPLQPQSTTLDAVLTSEGIHEQHHEDVTLKNDDATVEPTSSIPITSSVSPTTSSPTKNDDNDSIISLESSNNDENEIFAGDSNHLMNEPVIKGEVTTGTSTRGGKMIFMNGFAYLYMSMAKETTSWRCARRNENCKAVIHISKQTGQFSHWNGILHCHPSDARETQKRDILNKVKHRVLDQYISIKIIIEEEYRKANLSVEEKRMMPLPAQIESGLHKLRRKSLPPIPQNQKFLLPPVYQETYSHQKFLIYDKRKTIYGGRLMIFASDEQLNVLYGSDVLFADGTFKVSPKLFEQLYVLHGMQNGEAIPVCFILTSNRKQETYEATFRCLKRIGGKKGIDLKPTTNVCDFERAFINAVQTELPDTSITGCWFHMCQACYRNIQEIGLMKLYESDPELRHILRAFMGLALVPIEHITDGFNLLKQKLRASSEAEKLRTFLGYFKKQWFNNFKPEMWSVSDSNWRTNNFAEAQNRRFFSRVVQPHPNLWRFIQCLKQEEAVISHRMVQTDLGFSSTKSTKTTQAAERKSKQIKKLLSLLYSKQKSLEATLTSFAYLVGDPKGTRSLERKNRELFAEGKLKSHQCKVYSNNSKSTTIDQKCGFQRFIRHHSFDGPELTDKPTQEEWTVENRTKPISPLIYRCTESAKYLRCSCETQKDIETLYELMRSVCDQPKLIISVYGGRKYFTMSEAIEKEFMDSVAEAATTSGKIIL
ncbi:unnamed protein product [Rotaria magnacalcarata]|uniref:MULE transposase domain-containing protein n=1 Tax=Rotaria magnacalcarata TaxID=392030 RepID=A0A819ZBY0_9BILA|nr:unnamed protein product [Rotaria magnacalcarata]